MKKFLGIFVSTAFIGWLLYSMRGDFPKIIEALKTANHGLIVLALGIYFLSTAIMAYRLKLIFRAKGIEMGLVRSVNLTLIGFFFNNFLPTSVGGDMVKALSAARIVKNPLKAFTVVMMDRVFGLFMFIIIPCASLFFLRDQLDPRVTTTVFVFLGIALSFFFFIFNPSVAKRFHIVERFFDLFKIGGHVRRIYDELHDFKNHKGIAAASLALSVVGQSISIIVLYLFGLALGAGSSTLLYFFLMVPIVHLISMIPVSFGGLGIREKAYVVFLAKYVGGPERAFAIAVLWLALLFFYSLLGGLVYAFRHDYHVSFKKANFEGVSLT